MKLDVFHSPTATLAIPLLEILRKPRSEDVFNAALWSLGGIGVVSPEVLEALAKLVPEKMAVARAVVELSKKSTRVVEMLLDLLGGDRESKSAAIICLEWMEERAAPAIPFLEALAGESDPELSQSAGAASWRTRQALSGPQGRAKIDQALSAYDMLHAGK